MIYDYNCKQCGEYRLNVYNKIDERRTHAPECCGEQMQIVMLQAPMGFVDNMEEYICPVTRQGVTTRTQRNEIMAREGLVDANDLLTSWESRQKQSDKAQSFRKTHKEPKELREQVDNWAKQAIGA